MRLFPNGYVEALTHYRDGIWRRGLWEIIRFRGGYGGGILLMDQCPLGRDTRELVSLSLSLPLPLHIHNMRTEGEALSLETGHSGTLNLNL